MGSAASKPFYSPPEGIQPFDCLTRGWELVKDQYWLFLGITVVGLLIANTLAIVLMGPMMSGINICYLRKLARQPVKFEMVFQGFDYFKESFIAGLIITGFSMAFILPVYFLMFIGIFGTAALSAASEAEWVGVFSLGFMLLFGLMFFVVIIGMSILFIFVFPLIVDRYLSGWEAIKLSARAGWANFWGLLGLMLLLALLTVIGVMFCYIGVFFVIPVNIAAFIIAYRKLFSALEEAPHEA